MREDAFSGKTLAETGELAFIRHIRESLPGDGGMFPRSVGDDCLIAEPSEGFLTLVTTDTFVESVHFTSELFTFEETGHRSMAASVSDIAAMSGIPVFSLVSLSMPGGTLFDDAAALFNGLREEAERYGCPVAGGETTSTPGPVTITVTVVGKVEPGRAVTRSGAEIGDGIFVTGTVGDAMAGLSAFQKGVEGFDSLKRKFVSPEALVTLSRALTERYRITSMIDVSDGVATDLGHICGESGCGAEIEAGLLPFSDEYRDFAGGYDLDAVDFALSSGEEFELLFTSGDMSIPGEFTLAGRRVTRIGTVVPRDRGMTVVKEAGQEPLQSKGYEHFRS